MKDQRFSIRTSYAERKMRRHIHKECPDLPTDRQRFSSDELNGQPYTVMNLFIKNLHDQSKCFVHE